MRHCRVLAACVFAACRAAAADCTTYVVRLDGKGDPPQYVETKAVALSEVAASGSKVRRVGMVGGHLVYEASSSERARRLVWDRGDWSFCTALDVDGDESIIVGIHEAKVLRSGDSDVVHVRIQYEGTGHFQKSLFFAVVGDALVHAREPATNSKRLADWYAAHKIRPYHRGLGFCEDSLTEEQLFEMEDEKVEGDIRAHCTANCRVIVRYKLERGEIVVESIGFGDHKEDCEMFPEW